MSDALFATNGLRSVLEGQLQQLKAEVESYDGNRLLNTSTSDLCDYFEQKYVVNAIDLREDEIVASQAEAQVDVSRDFRFAPGFGGSHIPGTEVTLEIPFSGDEALFKCQPSSFYGTHPYATVRGGRIALAHRFVQQNPKTVKDALDREVDLIRKYLVNQANDITPFNAALRSKAESLIEDRRARLLKNQDLVASLGYPLKRRENMPVTYTAPEVRRKMPVPPPPASTKPFAPEPALDESHYEQILDLMFNMARVMECNPSAFQTLDEESLRSHFLVQLNGQFEGQATGETFNFEGKTDILVRSGDRNIFIAECKFWKGTKALTAAIDQLLRYTAWRDTKTALVVFNKNKDFSRVLESIESTMREHNACKRTVAYGKENAFRYVFGHRDDSNREIVITALAFEVPG